MGIDVFGVFGYVGQGLFVNVRRVLGLEHFGGLAIPRPGSIIAGKFRRDVPSCNQSYPLFVLVDDEGMMVLGPFEMRRGVVDRLILVKRLQVVTHNGFDDILQIQLFLVGLEQVCFGHNPNRDVRMSCRMQHDDASNLGMFNRLVEDEFDQIVRITRDDFRSGGHALLEKHLSFSLLLVYM